MEAGSCCEISEMRRLTRFTHWLHVSDLGLLTCWPQLSPTVSTAISNSVLHDSHWQQYPACKQLPTTNTPRVFLIYAGNGVLPANIFIARLLTYSTRLEPRQRQAQIKTHKHYQRIKKKEREKKIQDKSRPKLRRHNCRDKNISTLRG